MKPLTDVKVKLVGKDGNAFLILGKVKRELKRHGFNDTFINEFMDQATNGDYDDLLNTVMRYVIVE